MTCNVASRPNAFIFRSSELIDQHPIINRQTCSCGEFRVRNGTYAYSDHIGFYWTDARLSNKATVWSMLKTMQRNAGMEHDSSSSVNTGKVRGYVRRQYPPHQRRSLLYQIH
ncbi:hypothetical protein PNO31109_03000 [Pandoraea nosoerga]|uniref:Uncharacterized protein n=1 Tax=Pandoraea nosoerga TaxID=2508296 RepID=A0A5E4W2L7_9BURK|nr:hypothetical protein PNO31109_03000 [Pandoraea nosoerga]